MIALFRLIAIVVALELLFYVLLSIYFRSLRRESLEEEWARRHPQDAGPSERRDAFVERAMIGFNRSLRMRLVALVLVLPMVAVMVIVYIVNVQ